MIAPCRGHYRTLQPVAICFVRAKVIGRSGGKSATAAAAYRSGEKIEDRATKKTHDYTKKQGIDHSEILSPIAATAHNEWLTNRSELWNRVEASEKRYDAQLAREMIIAIPRELDRENQINLVREYVRSSYIDRGMIADINLHHLDGDNPHAHVMLTMRELKIDEQGLVSFGNKDRTWNDKKLLETQIKEWEVVANQYLERAGIDTRIDSRSYEEQGISRIPQIHLGKNVTAMRRQNIPTERGDLYDQIDRANAEIQARLEEIYKIENEISNLEAQATAIKTEREKFTTPTRPDLPELLQRLPTVTGERTCNIGRYQTKQFTNPSIDRDDKLIASYTRVGQSWMVKLEGDFNRSSLLEMETVVYAAVKLKHITADLTRNFEREFRRADLTDPVIRSLLDETIVAVDRTTPIYDPNRSITFSEIVLADLQQQITKHQEQQRAARQQERDAAATERYRTYTQRLEAPQTPSPSPQAEKREEKGSSLKERFASFARELFDRPQPKPNRQKPTPQTPSTKNQPTKQPEPDPTRPDLAELAIALLEKMDSRTVSFDDYGIELINGGSSQPIVKVSQNGKPLMQMNKRFGEPWRSELKNQYLTLNLAERLLERQLKTYNIKMDLAKDYRDRVVYKIGDVDRSIWDNDDVKSTARNIIDEGMKKINFSTYDSNSIVKFNDDSIKTLTDTIARQIELERIKSIEIERARLIELKTNRDIVATAGELRAAYSRKLAIGDAEAADKIREVGARLNAICPDELKVNDKAPDDFKDESVFINQKYIHKSLKELQAEIDSQPKIIVPVTRTKQEKRSQSQDYDINM
jgi:MobA/MobL family